MPNPFKPGTVYYADVPAEHVLEKECRNSPGKGPRPWIVVYCREHGRTGLVIAAPLYSKGDRSLTSHVAITAEQFDDLPGDAPGLLHAGYIHLEQLRALDKHRLLRDGGALARMKRQPFHSVRATLMGMLEPRLLPS